MRPNSVTKSEVKYGFFFFSNGNVAIINLQPRGGTSVLQVPCDPVVVQPLLKFVESETNFKISITSCPVKIKANIKIHEK